MALFAAFVAIERRTAVPLVPRAIVRSRTLIAANVGVAFAAASIYGMSFILALDAGLLGAEARPRRVRAPARRRGRCGHRPGTGDQARAAPVSLIGMAALAVAFVPLQRMPVNGSYISDMLPPLLVFGPALGLAFTSYSIATLMGVAGEDAGLASGLNNTFENVGGALGTAIMATVAATRTSDLLHTGADQLFALNGGFQLAFAIAITFPILGLLASLFLRRVHAPTPRTPLRPATVALETNTK